MLLELLRPKKNALLIHLLISTVVFAVVLFMITTVWYPSPAFWADGGIQAVQLIFGVDLVLGPLMTLIVYNPTKSFREIVLDMTVVAIIQTGALLWGVNNVYSQHPPAYTLTADGIFPIPLAMYEKQDRPVSEIRSMAVKGERLVWLPDFTDGSKAQESDNFYFQFGVPAFAQVSAVSAFNDDAIGTLESAAMDLEKFFAAFPEMEAKYQTLLSEISPADAQNSYLITFYGYYRYAAVLVSADGRILGTLLPDADRFFEYAR